MKTTGIGKLFSEGRILIVSLTVLTIASFAQKTSDLADPRLKANADLAQHNLPGTPIPRLLDNARTRAPSQGVLWKGLNIVAADHPGAGPEPLSTALLRVYEKQACQADAIVVGHITSSAYH